MKSNFYILSKKLLSILLISMFCCNLLCGKMLAYGIKDNCVNNAQESIELLYPAFLPTRFADANGERFLSGYINAYGVWVIPPEYEKVPYPSGYQERKLYPAQENSKWGFLNSNGTWEIQPMFDYVDDFCSNRALVRIDDEQYFIDEKGNKIISLEKGAKASRFHENIAVKYTPSDNLTNIIDYIFINPEGNEIFRLNNISVASFYSEGLMKVMADGKYGYINQLGQMVISPKYDAADNFSEGLAAVLINGKWGYIDMLGKWVIYPQFMKAKKFSEGLAAVCGDDNWFFINRDGSLAFSATFLVDRSAYSFDDDGYIFSDGLAGVYVDRQGGYIDKHGEWIIPPQFQHVFPFNQNLAYVEGIQGNQGAYTTDGWITRGGGFVCIWPRQIKSG